MNYITLVSNGIGLVTIARGTPEVGEVIEHNDKKWRVLSIETDTPRYTNAYVHVRQILSFIK